METASISVSVQLANVWESENNGAPYRHEPTSEVLGHSLNFDVHMTKGGRLLRVAWYIRVNSWKKMEQIAPTVLNPITLAHKHGEKMQIHSGTRWKPDERTTLEDDRIPLDKVQLAQAIEYLSVNSEMNCQNDGLDLQQGQLVKSIGISWKIGLIAGLANS